MERTNYFHSSPSILTSYRVTYNSNNTHQQQYIYLHQFIPLFIVYNLSYKRLKMLTYELLTVLDYIFLCLRDQSILFVQQYVRDSNPYFFLKGKCPVYLSHKINIRQTNIPLKSFLTSFLFDKDKVTFLIYQIFFQ